jgi:general L-amino acid transport system permease protein
MSQRLVSQILVIAALCAVVLWIVLTTQANLERLGVHSGIDFLWKRAGFELSQSLIPFDSDSTFARAFIVALLNTLVLAFVSILMSSILGLTIGVSRLSHNWLLAKLATAYVEVFRNIPSLLQIFFWYFVVLRSLPGSRTSLQFLDCVFLNNRGLFLPFPTTGGGTIIIISLLGLLLIGRGSRGRSKSTPARWVGPAIGIGLLGIGSVTAGFAQWEVPALGRFSYEGGLVLMPEFLALTIGLSMYHATYISEIVRSGFESVPNGQVEAADALGMNRAQSLRLVLFPQALRVIIPPLTTVYLNLFKGTSLAAAIAYPEVVSVFVGTVNNLVGQPVAIMGMTLIVYAFVSLCIALIMNWYNRRIASTGTT